MTNLPEPVGRRRPALHPSLVRAAASPGAIAATAAGAGIGVLDRSAALAVGLAAGGWVVRMVVAVASRWRRSRRDRPHPAELDPWSVPEPWRQLVRQATDTQTRFDQARSDWPPGPVRDHLEALAPRLYAEIEQVGLVARRGAAIAGWHAGIPASGRPTVEQLAEQLRRTEAEMRAADERSTRFADLGRREEAIAAQLRSLRRAGDAAQAVHDRLQTAVARLDESVTSLLTTGIGVVVDEGPSSLVQALSQLGDEITSLNEGLSEVSGSPPEASGRSMD